MSAWVYILALQWALLRALMLISATGELSYLALGGSSSEFKSSCFI